MTKRISYLITITCLLLASTAPAQNSNSPAHKFIAFLNHYERDSLQILLMDDFLLDRTYTNFANDKTSLLDQYLPHSKNFNGKFNILKTLSETDPVQFLVEDQSDYLKYLNIDCPSWKIAISTRGEKVYRATIDTTQSYQKYLADLKVKDAAFERWLLRKHPDETKEILYHTEGLLIRRLKEYAKNR